MIKFDPLSGTGYILDESGKNGATVAVQGYQRSSSSADGRQRTEVPAEKNPLRQAIPIYNWGESNDWPQKAYEEIQKNTIMSRAMQERRDFHYGKGIVPYVEFIVNGERVVEPVIDKEIEIWLDDNALNTLYAPNTAADYEIFNLSFTEGILSRNRKFINRLFHQRTASCRYELQDPASKELQNLYISHFWNQGPAEGEYEKVPLLNPYYIKESLESLSGFNFIIPSSILNPVNIYYPVAAWYAAVTSGWTDVSNSVPLMIESLYSNGATIKYHIQIPYYYWSKKYKDWANKTDEERAAIVQEEMKNLNKYLFGKSNTGKAFISHYGWDDEMQKEFPGWKIEALDDKIKGSSWLPNSEEATKHILYAWGLDSSITSFAGKSDGDKMAGSGSEKRQAKDNQLSKFPINTNMTLMPLYVASRYNGWRDKYLKKEKRLRWAWEQVDTSMTLAANPTGKKDIITN